MIDIAKEQVLTLSDATMYFPRRRRGKHPAVQTLYRWAIEGLRGIQLETIRVGGTLCTSLEACQRFCNALTEVTVISPAVTVVREA